MTTLLLGDYRRIDFETPISMTEEQKNKFISFLKTLYDPVEIEHVSSFREARLGSKEITAKWTPKEYKKLLNIDNYETTAKEMGRTEMSVIMRAGSVIPRLLLWAEEKGIDMDKITEKHIGQFLNEIEIKKLKRRKAKKIRNDISKKIDRIINNKKEPCMVGDKNFYGGNVKRDFIMDVFLAQDQRIL